MMNPNCSFDQVYKNIRFKLNHVCMEKGLKFAGLKFSDYPQYENIEKFHSQYKDKLKDLCASKPYVEIGYSGTFKNGTNFDYIFGCLIDDDQKILEGLTVFDTGLTEFLEMQFEAASAYELVGDENGSGDAMNEAMEYIKTQWLPNHRDQVELIDETNNIFAFNMDGVQYLTSVIEIYKVDITDDHKMSYYIPLKKTK